MKNQPFKTQVKEVSGVKINLRQLSIINRKRSRDQNQAQINRKISVQCSDVIVVEKDGSKVQTDGQYKSLKTFLFPLLYHTKYSKCEHIEVLTKQTNRVLIVEDNKLLIKNSPTEINAFTFL